MSQALNTLFRRRAPTPAELDDLTLIELTIRDQATLDEQRRPLPQPRPTPHFTGNVREIADVDTSWQVPGVLDWSTMTHNPYIDVTKETTTL